jgi:TonB family protein
MVDRRPGDRPPPASGRVRIDFEVLVGADGTPLRVRMLQSSGLGDLDEQMIREWQQQQFQPALLDGAPIQGLYRTDGLTPRL